MSGALGGNDIERLKREFDRYLWGTFERAKKATGRPFPQFVDMLSTMGGVTTAIRLINASRPSDGYTALYEKRRLDLTVEAVVAGHPQWFPLFDAEVIERARKRLERSGYEFPETAPSTAATGATSAERAWTPQEVVACVSAYIEMLRMEIDSQPYSKVAANRAVQSATGRTKSSIEFKFRNVSAVLDDLGLRWIQGYKPARNAQTGAIKDALDRLLGANGALAKRLEVPVPADPQAPPSDDVASVFADPPPMSEGSTSRATLPPGSNVKKFDRALTDAKNRDLGRAGEEFVLKTERERLTKEGRADLAAKVTWTSEEQGDGAGYDIASFEEDGCPRLIEVKTTNGAAATSFLVAANEVEVSRANPDTYWLYRVYDFAKEPRIYCVKGPLDDGWTLEPAVYRAKR
jgi:hypothetical protein